MLEQLDIMLEHGCSGQLSMLVSGSNNLISCLNKVDSYSLSNLVQSCMMHPSCLFMLVVSCLNRHYIKHEQGLINCQPFSSLISTLFQLASTIMFKHDIIKPVQACAQQVVLLLIEYISHLPFRRYVLGKYISIESNYPEAIDRGT